jgi:hypothetical protein
MHDVYLGTLMTLALRARLTVEVEEDILFRTVAGLEELDAQIKKATPINAATRVAFRERRRIYADRIADQKSTVAGARIAAQDAERDVQAETARARTRAAGL